MSQPSLFDSAFPHPIPDLPKRRDMTALRDALEGDEPTRKTAIFNLGGEGIVAVTGKVQPSWVNPKARVIAGRFLSEVHDHADAPSPISGLFSILDPIGAAEGDEVPAEDLAHGDLVQVEMTSPFFEDFTLTGIVTTSRDAKSVRMVGDWSLIDTGERGPRIVSLKRVAPEGLHSLDIPERRQALST